MALPPPPPPGPPPPPMFGGGGSAKKGSGDTRNALLQSIQQGAKLKKTVTVDKSGPLIGGKVSTGNGQVNNNSSVKSPQINSQSNGQPKLAGIFGGLASMPKLKPVGERGK